MNVSLTHSDVALMVCAETQLEAFSVSVFPDTDGMEAHVLVSGQHNGFHFLEKLNTKSNHVIIRVYHKSNRYDI